MVSHLYQKLDMSDMYQKSQWTFYSMYSFILFIAILKAHLSFYGMTFKNLKKRKEVNQLKKQDIGLFPQSIIWQYFVLGKKKIDL
jgi:hypothetical protein